MPQPKVVSMAEIAKEIGAFTEEHMILLKQATARGAAKSIPTLVEKSPVDTGLYAQSWDFTEDEKGVFLGNYAPHAPIIEYGARPFTPPIEPLLAWAKRVLQDPSQPPNYSEQVKRLAYYTQKKISEEGMKPRLIMESTIPEIIENIKQEYKTLYG